jgi:N-acylneuraminate cytidylyltransferase
VIGKRRVLGLIPARGGSKGLPGKNILPVNGRPLLAWTIDASRASRSIDRYILSSDDERISTVARSLGCDVPFVRPSALATDTATSMDVVMHALDSIGGFDVVVLLQPTSPLRTAQDIDAACALLAQSGAPACVSVSPVEQHPYWMFSVDDRHRLAPFFERGTVATRRQDLPDVYALNGAIYVADVTWLRGSRSFLSTETVGYVMPAERSIDIDTKADFQYFQALTLKESDAQVSTSS